VPGRLEKELRAFRRVAVHATDLDLDASHAPDRPAATSSNAWQRTAEPRGWRQRGVVRPSSHSRTRHGRVRLLVRSLAFRGAAASRTTPSRLPAFAGEFGSQFLCVARYIW
jgi:hypothetical protein